MNFEVLELAQKEIKILDNTCVLKEMTAKKAQEFAKTAAGLIQSTESDADDGIYKLLTEITGLEKKFLEDNLSVDMIFRILEIQSILNGLDREKKAELLQKTE